MVDIFSRKADFNEVLGNKEALDFHTRRFERGNRDNLARQCYQHTMMERDKISRATGANTRS